ncbi:MAG: hypothetical protein ACRCZZ_03510, partial [Phocaeicola sp.]
MYKLDDEEIIFSNEERDILEILKEQAISETEYDKYNALTLDTAYAKKAVLEYLELVRLNYEYLEEEFNDFIIESRQKEESDAKEIINNLTWTIVDPFYYNTNYDSNFTQHSC